MQAKDMEERFLPDPAVSRVVADLIARHVHVRTRSEDLYTTIQALGNERTRLLTELRQLEERILHCVRPGEVVLAVLDKSGHAASIRRYDSGTGGAVEVTKGCVLPEG